MWRLTKPSEPAGKIEEGIRVTKVPKDRRGGMALTVRKAPKEAKGSKVRRVAKDHRDRKGEALSMRLL